MTKGGKGDVLQRLSPTQNLGLGMMSGVMAKLCNYPLLSWKNSSQQSLPISFNPKVRRHSRYSIISLTVALKCIALIQILGRIQGPSCSVSQPRRRHCSPVLVHWLLPEATFAWGPTHHPNESNGCRFSWRGMLRHSMLGMGVDYDPATTFRRVTHGRLQARY